MKKKLFAVPPCWIGLITALLVGILSTLMAINDIESDIKMDPQNFAVLCFCYCIVSLVCFDLYEDRLVVKFWFIPIRSVSWKRISGAVYIPYNRSSQKSIRGSSVIFSIYPCAPYDSSVGSIREYPSAQYAFILSLCVYNACSVIHTI